MKRTFKVMGSLLLAASLIFGVVSCDNPSKGVDGSGTESDSGTGGGSELDKPDSVGSVGKVSTNGDVAELVCEDDNGGKYVFTQKLSVVNQKTAANVGGTWEYYLNGVLKYSGTFEGDITSDSLSTMTLKVEKVADESGVMKEAKATTFEFSISDNKFEAKLPSVEIKESVDTTDPFVVAIADVETYPTNEEEFVAMLDTVVTEVSESIDSVMSGNQRSIVTTVGKEAKTALEIVEQVNAFAKAVFECLPEYSSDLSEMKNWKIDFDKQINIGKVSFTEWFKALCEVWDEINNLLCEYTSGVNSLGGASEEIIEQLYDFLGLTKAQFEDYLVLLDDFVAIDKLYLNLDADADFKHFECYGVYGNCYDELCSNFGNDNGECEHSYYKGASLDFENVLEHKDEKFAAADVDYILAATVVDIEGLVNTILQDFLANDMEMTLPVKAISAKSEFAVNAEATYGDILSFMQPSEEGVTITQADVKSEVEYKVAVCTKEKVGGIVSITVSTSAEKQDILDLINVGYDTAGQITEAMIEKFDDMFSIKIAVSNGSEDVYSDTMLYSEFIDFVMEMTGVDVSGSGKVEY